MTRDSDHLIGTPFRVNGREPGLIGGMDCYGLVLAMAKIRGLDLADEIDRRTGWYVDSAESARSVGGWTERGAPAAMNDIVVMPNDRGEPTHLGFMDDDRYVIQATRRGVMRSRIEDVRVVRIYRHAAVPSPA